MPGAFWGQSSETLLARQRQLVSAKLGTNERSSLGTTPRRSEGAEATSLDYMQRSRQEGRHSGGKNNNEDSDDDNGETTGRARDKKNSPLVLAPSLRNSASLDDFLASSGPKMETAAWEASIGMGKLRAQQRHIRDIQSGIATSQALCNPQQEVKTRQTGKIDAKLLEAAFNYGQTTPDISINTKSFNVEYSTPAQGRGKPFAHAAQHMVLAEPPRHEPTSAMSQTFPALRAAKKRSKKKKAAHIKRKPSKSSHISRTPFSTSPRRPDKDAAVARASRAQADLDAMIADLSSGSVVQSLRRQLEASRRSLDESNTFIETATHEWFRRG
ncbi:Hypothetical Protein FCC1311_005582 [Hondaea fermentalgiana]|uniref:Uncharacterized protein n=1 Tax=Hondaea fermentalgiana TaxID=2315210 RepID=A0A2R5G021_9STRA|nr:Hypothetical Protein FCC1311_005582 [Hondaea fermentalgiana]|eukprot:GBG24340.1 Hypothetical Protein FCC1311_005582 [Hondaea fermentalgiana]